MAIDLDVQVASINSSIPKDKEFQYWANVVPVNENTSACTSVCLRIVDELEAKDLNKQYRHCDKATNVLSFPSELPSQLGLKFLGDIVICASVVEREAQEQSKPINSHWAHLLVHVIRMIAMQMRWNL